MTHLSEIEERLSKWAFYRISLQEQELGWDAKSSITSIGEGGGNQYPTTGICLILKYATAQQTDSWVKALSRECSSLADALEKYYLSKKSTFESASDLGISRRAFLQRVHDAKIWLCGRLNALSDTHDALNIDDALNLQKNAPFL